MGEFSRLASKRKVYPLAKFSRLLARMCRWLVIEFVPKDDPQVREMLLLREDIFEGYGEGPFEEAMRERFDIVRKEKLPGSPRTMYLMKVR